MVKGNKLKTTTDNNYNRSGIEIRVTGEMVIRRKRMTTKKKEWSLCFIEEQ